MDTPNNISYEQYLQSAVKIAREVGPKILENYSNRDKKVEYKGAVDLVTETDKNTEEAIIKALTTEYPHTKILGEESTKDGIYNWGNEPTWIIDPIDGTTNFVHRFPLFCVAIALSINKEIVVGMIYSPVLNEMFTATKGGGSYLNGVKLDVTNVDNLQQAVIATNVGYDRSEYGVEFMLSNIKNILSQNVQSIRMSGTAAWEMASVACGRLDCFYEWGIHPWDIAASSILITEAGGVVLDPSGGPVQMEGRRVLCGNPKICDLVSKCLGVRKPL
ncbi:inositol-phosphate phosphatase [Heterostelium album PN500]|uniref:Inositol-1-monophosphatase n=1 Tax=Heterostelium pallidum (strain ATCC 26659 / Pp 5 / PN500) TaxID=670386 RepID=D3BM60_HETP5|nr:inositol-phosphate phosphatase [Heterostelium album PN500]EFA77661.1 inositol-phosphate phosphatase [Heterostelium album PN500]|eukprot:XP_020429789.1 inositol-phosphate phosphatase [Heterostelium album PN500]